MFTTYAKATVAAISVALAAAGTAAIDGQINLVEGIIIAGAFFGSFGAVWATPNKP